MIRTMSFVDIGKKYNVSDNAIRKWCDNYNLPRLATFIKQIPDDEWEKIQPWNTGSNPVPTPTSEH